MFRKIDINELTMKPFNAIGNDWMLITARNGEGTNAMTASWGGLGVIWGEPVATCYIRPQRYTRELVDEQDYFTLCFFGQDQRQAMGVCGRLSGRDTDKVAQTGLTVMNDKAAPYFAEAALVLVCRKMYRQEMLPECFADQSIAAHYPDGDYHIMYIAKVEECLVRD